MIIQKEQYDKALLHKKEHACGGVPYEHCDILVALVAASGSKRILELGTGTGYSTLCLAKNTQVTIDTIDQDSSHLAIAQEIWQSENVLERIATFHGKAEAVLPTLKGKYDFIFFDGYAPSLKFLLHFNKLLRRGGLLVSANLYLKDAAGGRYMRHINNKRNWITGVFSDTAISVKIGV